MKKKEKKSENSERWLLTYSDLITLLMILFVLFYSISSADQDKYEDIAASLRDAFGSNAQGGSIIPQGGGVLNGGQTIDPGNGNGNGTETEAGEGKGTGIEDITEVSKDEYTQLKEWLYDAVGNGEFKDSLSISIMDSGIVITLSNDVLFDSGQADIKSNMKKNLDIIAQLLKQVDNKIQIGGHTDNVPINRGIFTSNWQLSAQRAANVVEYMENEYGIDPKRMVASGYGENDPIASNNTKEGRAKNRRISITILFNNNGDSEENNQ